MAVNGSAVGCKRDVVKAICAASSANMVKLSVATAVDTQEIELERPQAGCGIDMTDSAEIACCRASGAAEVRLPRSCQNVPS